MFLSPHPDECAGALGTRAKFEIPRPAIGFDYSGELMDALHLHLSIGKWLFEGNRRFLPISQNQRGDDAGCLLCMLLFKSGLSWGVSPLHTVKWGEGVDCSRSAMFCVCFSILCSQLRGGILTRMDQGWDTWMAQS